MQLRQRDVGGDEQPTPYRRIDLGQRHLELKDPVHSGASHAPSPVPTSQGTCVSVRPCHDAAARHPLLRVPEIDGDLEVQPQLGGGTERVMAR